MKLSGARNFNKSLTLNNDRIREINTLLLKFCEKITFTAITVSETRIHFENMDELLNLTNFGMNKIKEVRITGMHCNSSSITLSFSMLDDVLPFSRFGICCDYEFNNFDDEILFFTNLLELLDKSENRNRFMRKILLVIFGVVMFVIPQFVSSYFDKSNEIIFVMFTLFFIINSMFLVYYLSKIDKYIISKFFPNMIFLWGEEISFQNNLSRLKSNIFWVGIVGCSISVVGAIIYANLLGGN